MLTKKNMKNFPGSPGYVALKFMLSRKATKFDEIFTVNLTLCSKCQIDGKDFVNFCGLLRKHALNLHWAIVNHFGSTS